MFYSRTPLPTTGTLWTPHDVHYLQYFKLRDITLKLRDNTLKLRNITLKLRNITGTNDTTDTTDTAYAIYTTYAACNAAKLSASSKLHRAPIADTHPTRAAVRAHPGHVAGIAHPPT